jgi:NADH-quinone oxidoreductase subunit G/NADP-reducing hydrogenase subunit HndD
MKKQVKLTINGNIVSVEEDITILEAAKQIGIFIPNLCNHPDQKVKANCRICSVEVEGYKNLVTACSTKVSNEMVIKTNTPKVRETVRTILELIFADHPQECPTCIRNGNCELRQLADRFGLSDIKGKKRNISLPLDLSTTALVRDPNKCIKCGRCAEACHHIQGVGILYTNNRSIDVGITPEYNKLLSDVDCVLCGQCILACPVGAIYEKDETDSVWNALADENKHVVVQIAPSVRVSIAEEFNMPPGTISTSKIVMALKRLGFDKVFDTDFSADLTIIEEGNELLHRIKHGGVLPMLTSCSPGWINYIEKFYPELLPHVSSCKSPQQMFGAITKTYYAEKSGISPKNIVVVSIMPCTAKKHEAARPEMNSSGFRDVDIVLTSRELVRMLKNEGIDFNSLPDGKFDSPLGESTGAAAIFGASGGVMEAALRTVYEVVTGSNLQKLEFEDLRGMDGIKTSSVNLNGTEIKVGIAHGLAHAKQMMELIKSGESDLTFIEVMCCPGGCIGGGGQSYSTTNKVRQQRINSLYEIDENMPIRKSHENNEIKKLYEEYLISPLGEKSHHLLHTKYKPSSVSLCCPIEIK